MGPPRTSLRYRPGAGLKDMLDCRYDRVQGMARRPFDPASRGWRTTEYRQGDVLDRAAVAGLVAEADVVVHLAYVIVGSREESQRINLAGTRNVFEATVSADRPHRLVYTSSLAAYGYHVDNPVPLTEDVPARGSPEHYYSAQKAACEALLAEVTAGADLEVYVLRPCIVAGPEATLLVRSLPWRRAAERLPDTARRVLGRVPGLPVLPDPGVRFQLIHHDDVATAVCAAVVGTGPPGAYNLAGDGEITMGEFARALGGYALPCRVAPGPAWCSVPAACSAPPGWPEPWPRCSASCRTRSARWTSSWAPAPAARWPPRCAVESPSTTSWNTSAGQRWRSCPTSVRSTATPAVRCRRCHRCGSARLGCCSIRRWPRTGSTPGWPPARWCRRDAPGTPRTTGDGWAPGGETWVMAVDYDSGRRVAFGRAGAPLATLPEAVVASCSIPGWYRPTLIAGRRYVDGGVHSTTSLDLLADVDLDEIYVLAPMASYILDSPRNPYARLERQLRRLITIGLQREARKVKARGIRVTVLTPGPEDLTAIGANLMDPRRRIRVLDTSLRTSAAALATLERDRRDARTAAQVCRATGRCPAWGGGCPSSPVRRRRPPPRGGFPPGGSPPVGCWPPPRPAVWSAC